MHFADKALIAEITAKMLLEVKAVLFFARQAVHLHLRLGEPGLHRLPQAHLLPAHPHAAGRLRRRRRSRATSGFEQFDVVAGGETAGIPYAAWIADRLGLPMQYVRKKPKGFGRNAQIEGDIARGRAHAAGRGPHHRRALEDQFLQGAARRGRDRRPRVRQLLLRHLPRVEEDHRRPEREAALPRDLVGRAARW